MCDKKNSILFTETECFILSPEFKLHDEHVMLKIPRKDNMYSFDLKNIVPSKGLTCLIAKSTNDESKLWHRRLGHLNFKTLNKLVKGNLVRGLPSKTFENDHTCVACQKGKQHKATCKSNLVNTISQPLQILHMDLFGPTFVKSIMGKMYCLVITDDYSRFSWVFFLAKKDETSGILKNFITSIENQLSHKVKVIRCDNGTEFKNYEMNQFCGIKGIKREFKNARTPQQKRVAKRKNRTLIEAARTMVLVTKPHNKTPYELLLGRTPIVSFMRPFGCPITILNTLDHLGKFDGKANEGVLVGYSINSKAFRVYNHRSRIVEENLHVNFLENKPNIIGNGLEWLFDIDSLTNTMNYQLVSTGNRTNGNAGKETNYDAGQGRKEKVPDQEYILLPMMHTNSYVPSSPEEDVSSLSDDIVDKKTEQELAKEEAQILMDAVNQEKEATKHSDDVRRQFEAECDKDLFEGIDKRTSSTGIFGRAYDVDEFYNSPFDDQNVGVEADFNNMEPSIVISPIPTTIIHSIHPKAQIIRDPKSVVSQALNDESWVKALQEELLQFKLLNVWTLVDLPEGKKAIGTKWVYKNKKDQRVSNKVYKLEKALYGLHQAPKAWYETLSNYLLENGFKRGTIDKTLFIKKIKNDILRVQVYVDDIIFGSTKKSLHTEFKQLMHKRFQMSSMGELTFFLGLQVKQRTNGIFLSQEKYVYEIVKKFRFSSVKTASTPMETHKSLATNAAESNVSIHLYRFMIGSLRYLTSSRPDIMFAMCACSRYQVQLKASHMHAVKRIFRYLNSQPTLGLWYPKNSLLDLMAYYDSDYACVSIDRKSTTGGCQFLGCRLISWQCKKQTIMATSTTKAEYIAASNCCGQVLWLQNQLLDYGYNFMKTKIHIDNESTISVIKNLVAHSKTKHIEIRFHFIRDSYEKRLIEMVKIHIDYIVTNLLTKAFDVIRYQELDIPKQMALALAIPGQMTTGKESSNLLMAELQIQDTTSTLPHDSPLPGGYTPGSVEGSLKLKELTDLYTKLVDRVTILETKLKKTKEVHGKALTKLVKKVKKLEDRLKSTTKRRKARMVLSDDEETMVLEDPSKQGRMDEIEYADAKEEFPELSVLSSTKILAEASSERVKTYKRRSTDSLKVSTAEGTAKGIFDTAKETDEEIAKRIREEDQAKAMEQQEQEKINLQAAQELQRHFD
ncbi:putative ribonuclease H-like domain-containing protein, partial [Tanacetum coccineum]